MNNDGEDVRVWACRLCEVQPAEPGEELCYACLMATRDQETAEKHEEEP